MEIQDDGVESVIKWNNLIKEALEKGSVQTEWNCLINNDEPLPLDATFVRMPWKDRFRVAVYALDLRELRKREMAVRKANEENRMLEFEAKTAEAASKAKSDFLATMSHELRTPMNVIIGMSELIPTDNLNDKQKSFFYEIQNMSKTLLNLINDILDFSKIEAGKLDIILVNYSIRTALDTVTSMFRFIAEKKHLAFSSYIADDIPDVLYGDEIRIRQILTNIISNAVKYTNSGSIGVTISKIMKNSKAYMEIRVKDTGIGIRKEDKSRLFDSFQQLDARKNRGIVGTGLGLAICKKLVDIMEGSIDIESEYGKGSVFIILLPLVEGDVVRLQLDILSSLQNACNFVMVKKDTSVKILVVDDMVENLAVAKGFLELHGVDVDTALSGEETLNKVREKKYDLLFMDQMMPEMDGLDTTRHIRELAETTGEGWYSNVPVIALSANVESGAFQKFIGAGMNDSISKPIDSSMLNSKLAVWLPPEKVEFIAHPKTVCGKGENRNYDEDPIFKQLKSLNCIDLEDGLQHTGSVSSYIKVIRQYCLGFKKSTIGLQQIFEENDVKTYHIKVHALKGVFATLGVKKLSKWAEKLEFASADDESTAFGGFSPVCLEETMPFIKECIEFFDQLPAELKTDDTEKVVVKNADSDITVFMQKLDELKKALETGYANSINELIGGLCKLSFDEKTDGLIRELSRLSADFDYDVAVQKIKEFLDGRKN
jgi:signal transduction histidine kinase/HPt (histidine-containing phosphotransfer) domain-containing protein/ActR/RegA family two-component response regulator